MTATVSIRSAACRFPVRQERVETLFREEGAAFSPETAARLGVEAVRLCDGETGSALALEAAREALARAGVDASALDVIVDFSILPQEYLVPAWNMSNKLQHELGATGAFTLGFSGGGATNFLVALKAAADLIRFDERVHTALLVAADVTIPGNRILNPDAPTVVLGDGASAMLLGADAPGPRVLDVELWSDGGYHDVCFIPGGALAHPDRPELYRLILDRERFEAAPKWETLERLADAVLTRAGRARDGQTAFVYPNLSAPDRAAFARTFALDPRRAAHAPFSETGHVQGSDLVRNYLALLENGALADGGTALLCSHGMGFLYGVGLLSF
ncbi:hypothetical protein [Rhodocaloribacter sp.]